MTVVDQLRNANEQFASGFDRGDLPLPPGRKLAVVTCMDARLDPAQFLGLDLGDAHVIRNAGGLVSDDALRSLVISHHLLGTQEAVVIAHTGCGMLTFTNDDLHERLGPEAESVDFLPFPDLDESVRASARKIEASPLLPDSFGVTGFVYEVETGKLRPVALD
jgi:carbonic anhydrase